MKLLLPIDASDESRWCLAYALARRRDGQAVEAHLLHVTEDLRDVRIFRVRTRAEVAAFQRERAAELLADAAAVLAGADMVVQPHHRVGPIVATILAAAEELGCNEIVVPAAHGSRLFSRGIARALARRRRRVPVVATDPGGRGIAPDGGSPAVSGFLPQPPVPHR